MIMAILIGKKNLMILRIIIDVGHIPSHQTTFVAIFSFFPKDSVSVSNRLCCMYIMFF